MFLEDLLTQLRTRRAQGDSAILMTDANDGVIDSAMCKQLGKDAFKRREVVYSQTNMRGPTTYFKGQVAIDGRVSMVAYLSFDPELGDHQPTVFNISKKLLLGVHGPRIKPSTARQLNSKVKQIRQKYIDKLKEEI